MFNNAPSDANLPKEDPTIRRARLRSVWIAHVGMFIFSLGFSIVLTGVYPYMKQLLPSLSSDVEGEEEGGDDSDLVTRYGWVVSINPLGQLIFSPVFGWISNRMGSIRVVCLISSVAYTFGNVLYSILSVFPESSRYGLLLFCRFMIGMASGEGFTAER